jgi:hypothetical protein
VTWQPGPASEEDESPADWVVRADEPPGANPAWQVAGASSAAPLAAETMPLTPAAAPPVPAGPEPAVADPEPLAASSTPPADPGPAGDAPRPDVDEPAGQPAPSGDPASDYPQLPPRSHRGRSWAAMVAVLAIGLCALAAGAAGAVRQLLPREFSLAQQRQIQNWQLSRRWRAQPAGQIFPATLPYQVSNVSLNSGVGLDLTASRLGIAPASGCSKAVSKSAAAVLAAGRCGTVLRATYLDASDSMVTTVGVAALATPAAATAAASKLLPDLHNQSFALHALPMPRSAAASFRQSQRQYSIAMPAGPYVVLATAGFTDGRRHVPLATDDYIYLEMSSLVKGLVDDIGHNLGKPPLPVTCPGAPGC